MGPRKDAPTSATSWHRFFGAFLATVYFVQSVLLAASPESNFWSERRRSQTAQRRVLALAALPGSALDATRVTAAWPVPAPESAPIRFSVPPALRQEVARVLEALPAENIRVRGLLVPKGPPAAVLVHLQDVHLNPEAQTNLGQAVSSLAAHRLGDLVALEGVFEGVPLAAYRQRPEREVVRSAADYFLRINKISGPVHALMTAAEPAPVLVGVDDRARYDANVAAYRRSGPVRSAVQKEIADGKAEVAVLKSKRFSPALTEFDAVVQRRRDNRAGLGEYAHALNGAAPPELPRASVRAFLQAFAMEKSLDFDAVERERRRLLESLLPRLTAVQTGQLLDWGASYRLGALSAGAFYARLGDLCRERGVALVHFPSMESYLRYVLAADRLRADDLMRELDALETGAYRRLAASPAERALVARDRRLFLAGQLSEFALSPAQWAEWRSGAPTAPDGDARFEPFADFYREAEARDAAMTANVFRAVRDRSARHPVLVTGGFHADSMDRRLADAGWVVVQAAPRLTRVDAAGGSAYLSVFAQERTPLEKLFAGEKLFLTPDPLEGERLMPFAVGAALDAPEAARSLYNAAPRPVSLESIDRTENAPGPGLVAEFAGGRRIGFAWRSTAGGERSFVQTPLKRGRSVWSAVGAWIAAGWLAASGPAIPAGPVAPPPAASAPAPVPRAQNVLALLAANRAALTPEETAAVGRLLSMESAMRALNASGEIQVPHRFFEELQSVNAFLRPRQLLLFPNTAPPGFALDPLRILRTSRFYPGVYYVRPLDQYQKLQVTEGAEEHGRYALGFTIVHEDANRRAAANVRRVLELGDRLPSDYQALGIGDIYRTQWPAGADGADKIADDLFESAAVHETEHRLNGNERDAILAETALGPVPRYKMETVIFMYASRFDQKDAHPYFRAVAWMFSRFCEETGKKSVRELSQWLRSATELEIRLLAIKVYVTAKGRPLILDGPAGPAVRRGLPEADVARMTQVQNAALPAGTANVDRYASLLARRWFERLGSSPTAFWVRTMARKDAEMFFADKSPVTLADFTAYARMLLAGDDEHLPALATLVFDKAEAMAKAGDAAVGPWVESSFEGFVRFSKESVREVNRERDNPALPHSVPRAVLWAAVFSLAGFFLPGLMGLFVATLDGWMEWAARAPWAWAAYHAGLALGGLGLFRRAAGPPMENAVRAFEEELLAGVPPSWRDRVRVDVVSGDALRAEARARGAGREAAFFGAVTVRNPDGVVVFVHKNLVSSWGPWEWLGGILRPWIAHHESRRVRHLLTPGRRGGMPLLAVTEPLTFLFRRAGLAGISGPSAARESAETPRPFGRRAAWWGWAALWASGIFFAVDPAVLQAALPLAVLAGGIRSVPAGARFSTLTVPVNVLDAGSGIRNGRIVTERAVSKIRRLLPDLARAGAGGVYLYNGLYTPSALGARVHTVPTAGDHVIEAGAVKVLVRNYQTKRMIGSARENGRSRAVPLSDAFGNNFSVDMSQWNPAAFEGATNEARWAELADFTADAHRWGLGVTVDLVPWLSPDALNENNFTWAKDKFEVAGDMAAWSDERLLNHYFDHALLRIEKDGKPARVMVGHFTPGKDQIDPDFSNPDYQRFLIDHLKRLIDAGVDRVRIDMAHRLGTPQKDAVWHAWTRVISEAKAHAAARGRRFQFLMESYPEYGNDQWRSDFLRLYPEEQVYEVDPFHAYEALVRGEGDGLTPLRNALETARRERNGRSVVFPSNYDEPSLRNLGGPKAAFLALLLTYERLGVPLMIDLRELLDEEGHNIPQAGGQDAHGDNFRHPFLRQIRPGFRALRRGMARSPHMDTLSSLRAFFDGAQRVDVLDTQYQNRFFAVGVRLSSGEYKIRVFDFFPERGYAGPWVEAPPALLSEDALARREGESETAWEERARSAWILDGTAGPLPWFVDEDRGVRYRRLPLRFENGTANLTLRPASSPALPHSVLRSVFWSFLFAAGGVAAVVLGPVLGLPSEGIPGLLVFSPFAWAAFHGAMALTVFSLLRPGTAPTPAELRSLESEILAGLRPEESRRVTVRPVTAQNLEAAARSRGAGWESRFFGAAVVREGDRVFVYVNESLAGSWGRWESLGRRLRSLVWFHENRRVRRLLRDNGAGATMPFLPLLEPLLYPFRPRPRAIDPASFLRDLYRPVPGEAQAIIEIHKRVMSVLRPGEFPWPLVLNALVHANHLAGASVEYHENDGFGVEVFNLDDREINGNPDEVVLRDSLLELGRRWVAAGGPSRAADPTPEDLWLLYPIARGLNPRLHSETGAVLERADFRALLRGLGGLEGGPALLRQLDEMNDDGSGLPTWADRGLLMPWETLPDHFGGMEFLSSPVWSEKENGRRRSPSEALSAIYGRPADRPASPVTSPRWSDLYARLIGEAVPEPLTISELFGALGLKYENRRFFDGLIAQPEVVAVLDPDPAELERIRRQGDEPLLTPSIPAFRDPRHRRSPAALADDLLSGRFPLPLIFKSNGASLGMGNIVLEKRGDALSLTMSYAERAGSQRFEQARGAMKVLTDRFPRGAWGQGPVRYRVDAKKSIFEVVIDRSSFADVFVSIVREFSTPSPRSYAVGMVERFSDGVLQPGGKAYETRLLLAGRVGDRAVEWQKEARDYGAFRQPGSFARHGVSGFFAGEGGLEEDLPYARMFEPLAGVVPALGTPPGRAAFEEYVQSELNRVFEGLGARLLALGVPRGLPLSMEMDLMWLPPVDGKFPRPLLLESKFYPKFGLGNDRERRLEITSRPLDTTAPNSLLYRIVRLTGTVLSRARPGTSLHRAGQWLDRQNPRWGVWGLTGEIPGLMAASLVLGPVGALAGLAAFTVLHLFLEALELHLARGDLGPGPRSLASTFTAVFTRNLRPQFLWFVLAYLPLAHFGPVPAALAWAVLAHLSYDLERMFPAQFRAVTRDLQSLHGLSAAWVVPPGSARVPVTLRSLFVRGYSPEELFAFDQRLPERGPDVFARYHTKAVVVAASRVGGIKSRARAFYAEAPGLGWPPSKIDQIRKAVEAVAALDNPRRVHWFEAEVRGRDGHVLAWPDAFAADVVDFLARRERSLGAPGLVQNYLLSAMLEFKTGLSEFERLEVVGTLVGQPPSAAGEALRRALADFLEEKARAAPAEPAPPAVPAATPAPSERRTLAQWVHAWTGAVESTLFPPADLRGQPGPHEFDFAQTLGENFERPLELDLDHPVDPGVVAGLIGAAIEAENEFFQNVTGELQRALTDLYRWHAGERGVSLYLYVDIAHHQVLIFSPVRSGAKTPGELRPEIRAISFAAGDRVREFTPTRPPVNSIVFSLARAGLWPGFLRRALDPQREMAEWKAGVLGLALEIPALLIAGLAMPSSAFHDGLGLFALAHVFLEARARLLEGRSTSAAWATALSQLPARLIALAPYAFLPGAPDAAHALAAVLVHLGFDFAVFGRPSVPNDPRDRQFERGLRFPYDEESLSQRFGSFNLSARDRFIGRDGRPGTVYSISLLASPAPDSPVARKIDALAADFLRQPFAAAFFMTPSPLRHLTLRPYVVTPAAPPSPSDWDRFAAAAAAEAARTPPYRYWVRNVGIDANSGRVGVWVDDRLRPDAPRGSIALFSPRRPLTAREARGLRAWVVRHRFDSFGEWNVGELALVQSDDSYFLTRRREKGLTLSAVPVSTTAADHPPALRRLNVRLWAPLAAAPSRGAGTGADIIVRPVSQTGRMVKAYGKAFDRIPAPLAARLEGVRNAMLLGPGSNADEIELLWRRLPHVREIHLVEVVPEYIKAQDDFLVQHPAWWVNADGDPIAYHVWRAPMGALPAELNGSMDFVFDHQVLDFGYLGRLGMESVARSLGRVLRPNGLHLSFIFGSEPALDDSLGTALFRDETIHMALRGAPGLPAIPDFRPTGVSAQAEDFRNLVRGTPAPGAVLSLGFGAGDDERYLARQLPDRRVIATTVGEAELRAARARTDTPGNLVYLHEDMRRGFDAAIGSIQHVYARLSLHYLARPELPAVVRELTHVLAPGGILYLVVKGDRDPWTRHPSARRNAANELTSYLDRGQTVYRRFASAADWTREFSEFDFEPLREPVETFERLAGDDHESHLITLVFRRREDRAGRLTEATRFKPRGGRDSGFNVYLKRAAVALAAAAFFATGAPAQTPDPALSLAPLAAPARALVEQGLVKTPEGKKAVGRFAAFIAGGGPGTQRVGNFASLPVRFLEELDRLNDGLAKDQLMVLTRGSAGNTTITPLRRVGPSPLSDQVLRATNIPAETQARGVGGEGGFTVRRLSLIYADRLELKARIVWDVLQLTKGRRNLLLPGWDILIDRQFPMGSAIVSLDAVRSSFEARWVIHEWLHRVGGKERDAILGEFLIAPWLQITTLEVGLMAYAGGPGGESEPARLAAREVFRLLEKELVPGREPPLSAASTLQVLASRGDLDIRRAAIRAWVKAAGRPFFTADTLALARKAGLSSDVLSALQAEEASALPEGTARRAQYENALAKETLAWLTAQRDSPTARRYLRAVALNAPPAPDAPLAPDTVVQLVRRIRGREVDSTFNNALAPLAAERKKLPANSAAAAAHDRGVALATTLLDNLLAQVRRDHQSQALPLSALSAAGAAAMSLVLAVTGIGAFDGPAAFLALLPGAWALFHGLLLTGALMGRGAAAATDESIRADAAARFRRYLPRTPVHFNFEEDFDALPAGVRVSFVPRAEVVARARKALETRPGEQALARFYAAVTLPRSDGGLDVLLSEDLVRPAPRFLRPLWAAARRLVLFHEARRVRSLSSVRGPRGPWTVMEPLDFVGSALRDRWTRPASAVSSPAVPGPSVLGEDLGRAAARRAPAGFDGRSILDALDRMVPVASQRVEDLGASAPAADLAAQRDEFVEAFRRQWAAETERPLSLGEARRSLAGALVQSRFESPVEIFQTREDLLRDHLVIVPPTYTPPELTAYVDAAVRASRGRRIVFAVPKGDDFQKTKRELFRIARRVRTAPNVAVFALPDGSVAAEDGPVLRLGVVARGLGAVAPSLITVPRSFSIDTSNLPDGPYRTAVFLLIDALLQAVPLRLSDLETIDRTARAVATSA